MVAIDDGWHRADCSVFVVDDRVYWGVADNVQIAAKMLVFL